MTRDILTTGKRASFFSLPRWKNLLGLMMGVIGLCHLSACSSFKWMESQRTLTLLQPETKEAATQTYWHSSQYDTEAVIALSRIFRDSKNGDIYPVDTALLDYLYALRRELSLPPSTPIHIINGYRDPSRNRALAASDKTVAKESLHIHGKAADIRIPGVAPAKILKVALALKRGGAALYPKTGHVHIDTGPVRTWSTP